MKITKFLFLIGAVAIFLVSCEKNSTPLNEDDLFLADDEAVAEALFDDLFNTVDGATQMLDVFMKSGDAKGDIVVLADSCPMITVEIISETSRIITVDYGEGCTGFFDQTRSGKIIIEVNGFRKMVGSVRTVTFDNYFVNDVKIEGTRMTENLGANENENVVFMSTLTDGKVIFPDEIIVEREFTRYREWIVGYDTRTIWDDECFITGDASGTTYKGLTYQNTIITALHRKRVCRFFVSGVIEINREDMEPLELDYGDGECDAIAVVRRGDEEKEITLRWRHRVLR